MCYYILKHHKTISDLFINKYDVAFANHKQRNRLSIQKNDRLIIIHYYTVTLNLTYFTRGKIFLQSNTKW